MTPFELSEAQIEEVLSSQIVGRIGCHSNGQTYVVPITYAYDGRVIGHTIAGRKIQMMRENPQVCFEVEDIENIGRWRSVISWGTFEELSGEDAACAMSLLVSRLTSVFRPIAGPALASVTPHGEHEVGKDTIVYCIHLQRKSGRGGIL